MLGNGLHDVGITTVGDRQHGGAEHLTASSAQSDVVCAKRTEQTSVSSREHESAEIAAVRLEEPKRMPLANHRC